MLPLFRFVQLRPRAKIGAFAVCIYKKTPLQSNADCKGGVLSFRGTTLLAAAKPRPLCTVFQTASPVTWRKRPGLLTCRIMQMPRFSDGCSRVMSRKGSLPSLTNRRLSAFKYPSGMYPDHHISGAVFHRLSTCFIVCILTLYSVNASAILYISYNH